MLIGIVYNASGAGIRFIVVSCMCRHFSAIVHISAGSTCRFNNVITCICRHFSGKKQLYVLSELAL